MMKQLALEATIKLAFSLFAARFDQLPNTRAGQEKLSTRMMLRARSCTNNTAINDSLMRDHGFSCLLESGGHSTLFDAGRVADKFMKNASQLG